MACPSNDADEGRVHLSVAGRVANVVFDRPHALNAMTWKMYGELSGICRQLADRSDIAVTTFRGAGGKAFIAGTDITQFAAFESGDDGIAYESRIDACVGQIERLRMPTVAICEGWVVGGGLVIAAACDLRIAEPDARFAMPIARTLGNCLSAANTSRLLAGFGVANVKRLLLLAQPLTAREGLNCGFVSEIATSTSLGAAASATCDRLATHAPLTMHAAKETIRRLGLADTVDIDDLIRLCYGSEDFQEGVASFVAKRKPVWRGI